MPKSEHQQEKTKQNQKQLAILVECVSACNLKNRIDGYVQVKLGSEKVHKTKTIFRTRNPIWTIRHNNVFILYTTEEKLSEAGGLLFTVMNYNRLVKSEEIGSVQVSKESILGATPNERVEYKLKPADTVGVDQLSKEEKDSNNNSHRRLSTIGHKSFFEIGHNMNVTNFGLALRFRLATEQDKLFMENHDPVKSSREKTESSFDKLMSSKKAHNFSSLLKGRATDKLTGERLYRVQPGPDPLDEEGTKWMTKKQLREGALEPSRNWIDAGSGSDRIFLEIIGCDGLPNLDTTLKQRDKTDPFVSIVFEDTAVVTDTINDTLNPRWMPWHQRAFVLRVHDPKSSIFIAAFDRDKYSSDDLAGRVVIRPSKFVANTEYLLHYNLHDVSILTDPSMLIEKRMAYGKIIIRLRIERNGGIKSLISTVTPAILDYVNSDVSNNFEVIKKTCVGSDVAPDRFDNEVFFGYITELIHHWRSFLIYVTDAASNLILWRGSAKVCIPQYLCPLLNSIKIEAISIDNKGINYIRVWAPINSVIAFFWGCVLVENVTLFPSFLLFCVPWLFFGLLKEKSQNPSPWHRPRSIVEMLQSFAGVKLRTTIAANECDVEQLQVLGELKEKYDKVKLLEEEVTKESALVWIRQQEEAKVIADVDDIEMESRYKTFTLNPLNRTLFPIQKAFRTLCHGVRFYKNMMAWELPELALIMAVSFFIASIMLAVAAPFLVWFIKWAMRLIVWIFLGPLMAFVDKFMIMRKIDEDKDEDAEFFFTWKKYLLMTLERTCQYVTEPLWKVMEVQHMRLEICVRYIEKNFPLIAWMLWNVVMPIVRCILGPLMNLTSLVDERAVEGQREGNSFSARMKAQIMFARVKREDSLKLKAMRRYRFGRYINATPRIGVCKFADIPLPESTAVTYTSKTVQDVSVARFKGSRLMGSMIHEEVEECVPSNVYSNDSDCSSLPGLKDEDLNLSLEGSKDIDERYFILDLIGIKLKNVEGSFRKSDPFFEIYAVSSGCNLTELIYRSEHVPNNLSPKWKPAKIDMMKLCGGNKDKQFRISVFDFEKSMEHEFMGSINTTVNKILASQTLIGNIRSLSSIDTSKALTLTKGADRKAAGKIIISGATLSSSSSFGAVTSSIETTLGEDEKQEIVIRAPFQAPRPTVNHLAKSKEVRSFTSHRLIENDLESYESDALIAHFIGTKLENVNGPLSKSDPFYEIYATSGEGDITDLVYCSEFVLNNLHPCWCPAQIDMLKLCGGDKDREFRIAIFDYSNRLKHSFMGSVDTTVNELIASEVALVGQKDIDSSKALILTKGANRKASGKLIVCGLSVPVLSGARADEILSEENRDVSAAREGSEDDVTGTSDAVKDDAFSDVVDNSCNSPSKIEENKILDLHLVGVKLKNVEGLFRKSDPFFEVYAVAKDGSLNELVYRSEYIPNNLNPKWKSAKIDMAKLCDGKKDVKFRIDVFDYERSMKHDFMGSAETSVNDLIAASIHSDKNTDENGAVDTSKALILTIGSKQKESGKLLVCKASLHTSTNTISMFL